MRRRLHFWWRTLTRAAVSLTNAAGWLGAAVLLLGTAGIVIPLVFHVSFWLTAVVLLVVLLVVVLEGAYRVWDTTDKDRTAAESAQPQVTMIGGAGGGGGGGFIGGDGGPGGAVAEDGGTVRGSQGGNSISLLEMAAYNALGSDKPLAFVIREMGWSPDDPDLLRKFGGSQTGRDHHAGWGTRSAWRQCRWFSARLGAVCLCRFISRFIIWSDL